MREWREVAGTGRGELARTPRFGVVCESCARVVLVRRARNRNRNRNWKPVLEPQRRRERREEA